MVPDTQPYPTEYLDHLQQAALAYLRRHQASHLAEQALFSSAIAHLQATLNANRQVAENTVARAYGELHNQGGQQHLDVSMSTGDIAVLVDAQTGIHYALPVATIFKHLINTPARRRLAAVN